MPNWVNYRTFGKPSGPPLNLSNSPDLPYLPDNHHIILDPEYADPRTQPGRFDSVYRDDEGNFHPLTYRPFPLLTPPPKKEPRERIAHFDKFNITKAPGEVEPPYDPWLRAPVDAPLDDSPERGSDGTHSTAVGRWWAQFVGSNNGPTINDATGEHLSPVF